MTERSPPFVQTDFTDSTKWDELLSAASKENDMGFCAYVDPISEERYSGADPQEVAGQFSDAVVVFIVDLYASQTSEILCVDGQNSTAFFRAKPDDLWMVENNLSIGNLLFEELLEHVDENGVLVAPEM